MGKRKNDNSHVLRGMLAAEGETVRCWIGKVVRRWVVAALFLSSRSQREADFPMLTLASFSQLEATAQDLREWFTYVPCCSLSRSSISTPLTHRSLPFLFHLGSLQSRSRTCFLPHTLLPLLQLTLLVSFLQIEGCEEIAWIRYPSPSPSP